MRRIAFFGGSFDPPHRGHLAIARAAAERFALDQVLFAPVGRQPFKAESLPTPFVQRYAMTALATQADARFVPSLLDAPSDAGATERPNFTVDTLMRLRDSLAAPCALFALVGADSWLDIGQWHRATELLALCDWIVAARPGFDLRQAADAVSPQVGVKRLSEDGESDLLLDHSDGTKTRVWFLPDIEQNISATEVRSTKDATIQSGIEAVEEYIHKARLYRKTAVEV